MWRLTLRPIRRLCGISCREQFSWRRLSSLLSRDSELLKSPRGFYAVEEYDLTPTGISSQGLRGSARSGKLGHAAAPVADLSAGPDLHHRGPGVPTRERKSSLFPRPVASISAWPKRCEELPDDYQPID